MNAITSWTHLRPKPEVILVGDDEGAADFARDLELIHVPEVERNEFGTPLLNSIFENAEARATHDLMCYVNADIILMSDFVDAVRQVEGLMAGKVFLMVGRKKNMPLAELLDFEDPQWEQKLRLRAGNNGIFGTTDVDYFVFRKGLWQDIPPFAIGRFFWTQWLLFNAKSRNIEIIDATPVVTAIESAHDYTHVVSTGHQTKIKGIEVRQNGALFGKAKYVSAMDATGVLTSSGLAKRPLQYRVRSLAIRFSVWTAFCLKESYYPYSLPLILLYKLTRPFWLGLRRLLYNRV